MSATRKPATRRQNPTHFDLHTLKPVLRYVWYTRGFVLRAEGLLCFSV
jgi:hypothetical protein